MRLTLSDFRYTWYTYIIVQIQCYTQAVSPPMQHTEMFVCWCMFHIFATTCLHRSNIVALFFLNDLAFFFMYLDLNIRPHWRNIYCCCTLSQRFFELYRPKWGNATTSNCIWANFYVSVAVRRCMLH